MVAAEEIPLRPPAEAASATCLLSVIVSETVILTLPDKGRLAQMGYLVLLLLHLTQTPLT
jgi:hypothetical protein